MFFSFAKLYEFYWKDILIMLPKIFAGIFAYLSFLFIFEKISKNKLKELDFYLKNQDDFLEI